MILNQQHLNERMSIDIQEAEIRRIREAPDGTRLFTTFVKGNTDVIETLIHKSGVKCYEGVAGYSVSFYKGEATLTTA